MDDTPSPQPQIFAATPSANVKPASAPLVQDLMQRALASKANEAILRRRRQVHNRQRYLQSEETFRRTEWQYQLFAEAIPQIVWTAEADGYNDYFNRRWFEYTGFSEEETYQGAKSALHPDDIPVYNAKWKESVRTGKMYEIEYRFRRAADGMYRWHLGRALPIRDPAGNILKWFGTCTDIHDQKMAEEEVRRLNAELEGKVLERTAALRQANQELINEIDQRKQAEEHAQANLERLRHIIDSMQLGAVVSDESRLILHLNHRFCELFQLDIDPRSMVGKPGDVVIAKALEKVQHPERYGRRLEETLQGGRSQLEQEVFLISGRILSRDYLPIIVGGKPKGHILLYRDITRERKIDAAKSEFMSLASHQLRTPLTAMRWALHRMERSEKDERQKHMIAMARSAAQRMAETITTMLTIAAVEARKVNLEAADIHLCELFLAVRDSCDIDEREQRTIVVDCHDSIRVGTDRKFLQEIVYNLLSNAIKYTPAGGTVTLRAREEEGMVFIDVVDTGYGIPAREQKKVFSKFFRGENIVDKDTKGTGLGLYLVSLLIHLLQGKIWFQSEENKGTTFTVVLPQNIDL